MRRHLATGFGFALTFASALALAACAGPAAPAGGGHGRASQPACAQGRPMVRTSLYFGLPRRAGAAARWQTFVRGPLARHFPDGFTVLAARGAWRSRKTGQTLHQQSRLVIRLHAGRPADHRAVEAVRQAYKIRFRQESVLRVDRPVCASF